MKIIGINGSPRKKGNSFQLLSAAIEKAAKGKNEAECLHLADFVFSGCVSCFCCKQKENRSEECVIKDDLEKILKNIRNADMLVLAMPVYYGDVPGMVRNLFERLFFPPLLYRKDGVIADHKKVRVVLIYDMNEPETEKYKSLTEEHKKLFEKYLGPTDTLIVTDTKQFDDYSRYVGDYYDSEHKEEVYRFAFPKECERVRDLISTIIGE